MGPPQNANEVHFVGRGGMPPDPSELLATCLPRACRVEGDDDEGAHELKHRQAGVLIYNACMANITLVKLFKSALVVFVPVAAITLMLALSESYLPANRITHECKRDGDVLKSIGYQPTSYERAFCELGYHAEFKDSWDRNINNIAVPVAILSGLSLVPLGAISALRKLTNQKK
jgi:hypothetical protein